MLERIFTGAEAGVERGALVGTCLLPFAYGGWLPRNREVEDGQIGDAFVNLHEVPVGETLSPAEKNILDSDATLFVLHADEAKSSSRIAKLVTFANTASKPTLFLTLDQGNLRGAEITNVVQFVGENDIRVLNITGSRENECPGIQDSTEKTVWLMFQILGVAGVLAECTGKKPFELQPIPEPEKPNHPRVGKVEFYDQDQKIPSEAVSTTGNPIITLFNLNSARVLRFGDDRFGRKVLDYLEDFIIGGFGDLDGAVNDLLTGLSVKPRFFSLEGGVLEIYGNHQHLALATLCLNPKKTWTYWHVNTVPYFEGAKHEPNASEWNIVGPIPDPKRILSDNDAWVAVLLSPAAFEGPNPRQLAGRVLTLAYALSYAASGLEYAEAPEKKQPCP